MWSKAMTCPATVLQRGEDEFVTGNCDQAHAADPKLPYKVKVFAKVNKIIVIQCHYFMFIKNFRI